MNLPNFIIIGCVKGGTTSLYHYLCQHPNVKRVLKGLKRKEVHYFDRNYQRGLKWYKEHFPKTSETELTGESSPNYFHHLKVPSRMKILLPNIKLILLLRNPIDRAYSNYWMYKNAKTLYESFEESIHRPAMFIRGFYARLLKTWYNCYDKSQILIIKSEDFFNNPQKYYLEVLNFLNLPHYRLDKYIKMTLDDTDKPYPPMKEFTRKLLKEKYEPLNKQLYELLGRDFQWK